ncbi:hypothetical protein COCOBI_03-0940 [Coccomyxa sp. Obi]|nr:hypothetical protein COCOBI_03-0940 [Coccomyxa sp. Obi]
MTSHVTTKAKAAVRVEPAHNYEDWTLVNLHHVSDALPVRKQVHMDDTVEFVQPPATKMDLSRTFPNLTRDCDLIYDAIRWMICNVLRIP